MKMIFHKAYILPLFLCFIKLIFIEFLRVHLGGITWATADITEGGNQPFNRAWAWVFWSARLPSVPVNEHGIVQIASKAVDVAYNSQVESPDPIWNIRGLSNNSWFRYSKKCD
jgi:hypothetical protein